MNIIAESNVTIDIIQEDFIDTYTNLSIKSVAMLKWVTTYSVQANFVFKTDDNMYMNLTNLIEDANSRTTQRFIMGAVINKVKPFADKRSKWCEPNFKGLYPRYTSDTAYLISGDVVNNPLVLVGNCIHKRDFHPKPFIEITSIAGNLGR